MANRRLPINRCVHDSDFMYCGGDPISGGMDLGGGGSGDINGVGGDGSGLVADNSGLDINTQQYDVMTGAGGAPLATCYTILNQSSFPSWFDNALKCNNTCLCKGFNECSSCGGNSGLAKTLSSAAGALSKLIGAKKTTTAGAGNTGKGGTPTPPSPISTQTILTAGIVGVVAIVVTIVMVTAISGSRGNANSGKGKK